VLLSPSFSFGLGRFCLVLAVFTVMGLGLSHIPFTCQNKPKSSLNDAHRNHRVDKTQAPATLTPVKINMQGKHASMNTDDRFTLDMDGFNQDNAPLRITPGGLNATEAWLILDRSRNGTWAHNVLDSDDLFGDHAGRVSNGYVDLEQTFRHEIRMDKDGNRYIDLNQYNWLGEVQLMFCRQFMGDTTPYASYDLKLLTFDRELVPARDVLQKVYITPWAVKEYDAKHENAILKRAWVQYNDGHFAQSVDQVFIFVQGIIRKLSPEEEARIREELSKQKAP
jgi:hypothetical protein